LPAAHDRRFRTTRSGVYSYLVKAGGRHLRRSVKLLALAAVLVGIPAAATAQRAGAAEPPLSASSNVHMLGHIPGTAAGMNFSGHYAYVSGWGGVTVLDIARPEARRRSPARSRCPTSRTRTSTCAERRSSSSTTARRATSAR
jgi:hypothetical protein